MLHWQCATRLSARCAGAPRRRERARCPRRRARPCAVPSRRRCSTGRGCPPPRYDKRIMEKNGWRTAVDFFHAVARRFHEERGLQASGSLAYTTLLALVPLLTAALAVEIGRAHV